MAFVCEVEFISNFIHSSEYTTGQMTIILKNKFKFLQLFFVLRAKLNIVETNEKKLSKRFHFKRMAILRHQ